MSSHQCIYFVKSSKSDFQILQFNAFLKLKTIATLFAAANSSIKCWTSEDQIIFEKHKKSTYTVQYAIFIFLLNRE